MGGILTAPAQGGFHCIFLFQATTIAGQFVKSFYCTQQKMTLFLNQRRKEVELMGTFTLHKHDATNSKVGGGNTTLGRREFLQAGAAGATFGLAAFLAAKRGAASSAGSRTAIGESDGFPNKITDACRPFDQKYTIFARGLWDPEVQSKWVKFATAPTSKESGRTQLDKALYNAGWAVEYRFAEWSMNGQPDTDAYQWNTWTNPRKWEFENVQDASNKVKKAAKFLGACLVGIARYDPLWTYSSLLKIVKFQESQPEHWLRPPAGIEHIPTRLPFEPKSVVVMAVEMDYGAIACSPTHIAGAGTGLGYSRMAELGWSVRRFLSELGYRSFACGNDTALSIPYAVAAGLGEIGRQGCLITREFGPRVRLVKVFTELELKPDTPQTFGVAAFCKKCKRCAESCPAKAIPFGDPTLEGPTISNNPGVEKWYLNPEKCFDFWVENGVDCANCITSCPYNKTEMWNHRLISRLTALPGDQLHYLMARMDKIFGYGNTFDKRANAEWWKEE
ncbi:MAG: reductive dehalogenase [Deltaproteobacteria bacterium]|nr:reductive dehalogenase [Deltaproteobacteria bacterium]